MTTDELQAQIKSYWPKTNMVQLKDMADAADHLTDAQRDEIFNGLRVKHTATTTPPVYGEFAEVMKELGIRKRQANAAPLVYRCEKCGTLYSGKDPWYDAYCCPRCFSMERSVIEDQQKGEVMTAQTMCIRGWEGYTKSLSGQEDAKIVKRCPIWEANQYAYGPTCEIFYDENRQEYCASCACRECCATARKERRDMGRRKR